MKYLDFPILNQLSESLSDRVGDPQVQLKLEAYSVKPVGREKRAFKEREEAYISEQEGMDEMSFSPEMRAAGLASCFGRLDEKESRSHFLLVSTLNSAFPDHDFTSLRPDHFTREPSAAQVLAYLSGSLLGSAGAGAAPLYRVLNDVVQMDDCEVYSWFPEPEYDPHMDPGEAEMEESDDGYFEEEDEDFILVDEDKVGDSETTWGTGMDLDIEMEIEEEGKRTDRIKSPAFVYNGKTFNEEWNRSRKASGLLWSANYFFYNKRQKRILFLTCWCRHVPVSQSIISERSIETSALPSSITASVSPSSFENIPKLPAPSTTKQKPHSRKARRHPFRERNNFSAASNEISTIPIRGLARPLPTPMATTPRSERLAISAPGEFSGLNPLDMQTSMTRMKVGGFKPRQTPARILLNAKAEEARRDRTPKPDPSLDVSSAASQSILEADGGEGLDEEERRGKRERRRGRSESTTPGPSSALTAGMKGLASDKGKKLKT
ncbi:uncharacterized protein L203_103880 [Cryptococcus depauperatus CBS 7841]|uniref:Uncharacterized protein n=1 Tax=Cryptococcus depauperatus CBS 7841 TaxID=1295531 RepID=A0AAJ8M2G5_9TREE